MTQAGISTLALMISLLIGQPQPVVANGGPIAQVLCAPTEDMRQRLEIRYRAHRAWAALRGPDEVMELWEDAGGDWTLIITYAGGKTCIVAMGDALDRYAHGPHG